ncbi:MAG: tripartite tricarboxylate transporter TctB family protein [Hyphomicrobiaceae bacterium]
MRRVDIIAAIVLLAFVALMILWVIPAENDGDGVWYGLSPYFYPMVMLVGIALSSIGLLAQAITKRHLYDDQPNPLSLSQFGFFLLVTAIIIAGTLIITYFGFLIGGPLLISATMLFMGETRLVRIVPVSLGTVVIVSMIVSWGLKTPLP